MGKFALTIAGFAGIVLATMYFTIPAGSLPLPDALGHQPGASTIHVKHGIAALLAGVVCLLGAWRIPARS